MAVAAPETLTTWSVNVASTRLIPGIPTVATVGRGNNRDAGSLIVASARSVVRILASRGCQAILTSDAELLALDGEHGIRIAEARA